MRKALVLGGSTGLLGQALVRVLSHRGWQVETLGRCDGNLLDMNFLQQYLERAEADAVFNAVAWTRAEEAEEHPEEALLLNRTLPDALARVLRNLGSGLLVHFSSDRVFAGHGMMPLSEDDTPAPISVYGQTKLAGEQVVLNDLPERSLVIRTAWLFGPGRSNFVQRILDACFRRDAISVVHDQTGSPSYTLDVAFWSALLAEAGQTGLWHAVNSGRATWCELASEAVSLTGEKCRVQPIPASHWPHKAARPEFSVLDCGKLAAFLGELPRPWPQALREYLYGEGLA